MILELIKVEVAMVSRWIELRGERERLRVRAEVIGCFGIHRVPRKWGGPRSRTSVRVTHVPTGYSTGDFRTATLARAFIRAMRKAHHDWTFTSFCESMSKAEWKRRIKAKFIQ